MGGNCNALKDWRYQKQMEFLVPYMFTRRSLTKIDRNDSVKEDDLSELAETFDPNNKLFKPEVNYQDFRTEISCQEEVDANNDGEYSKFNTIIIGTL